ncbi:chaperonin 10-like protein [Aspergillus pseudoustus]|uniref:Chaperonin 10-like protein n=1 Tax=Aspergillus pseudoustus TaxID=1810923 RepID=A0ABR4IWZ1_9EURO
MALMRAVVFKGVGQIVVEDKPVPQILEPTDVIMKVELAGICGSDLHWFRGHQKISPNFIPGHEFVGSVHSVGDAVRKFQQGDHVVSPFTAQCGECFYCRRKQTSRCDKSLLFGNRSHGIGIDGGQAEYVRVPFADTTLVHSPQTVRSELLVLMSDIFPTGYFCAARFLKDMSREEAQESVVVVVGCGPVGICAIASALTWCPTVYAIDMVPGRLAEAQKMGAKPLRVDENPESAIKEATNGRGADVVLEVVGTQEAMQLSLSMVRPFGHISSVGVCMGDYTFSGPELHGKNATIAWGRCPVRGIFEESLECLARVQSQVAFLCGLHMALEDAPRAYEMFNQRKAHKIILKF